MKKKPTKFADGTRPVECVCCGGYNPECEAHDGPPPEFEIVSGDAAQRANPNAKLMVNTTRHWIVSAESFTSRMEAGKRIAELAALRARIAEAEAMNAEFIDAGAKLGIRLAELEAKPEPPTDYTMALDSLRDAMSRIAKLELELEKLRPLHEAVAAETHKTVPKAVYDAWHDGAAYRRSEIAKLLEQVGEAEHQTGVVRREMEARIAELERERDEATTELSNWARRAGRAEQESDALRAENARLRTELTRIATEDCTYGAGIDCAEKALAACVRVAKAALANAQEARDANQ